MKKHEEKWKCGTKKLKGTVGNKENAKKESRSPEMREKRKLI
jgi:hypothetical protein